MDKIKIWFKGTSFYYWWGLVFLPSIKLTFSGEKIMDSYFNFLITLLVAVAGIYVLGQVIEINETIVQFLNALVFLFLLRLGANLFYEPAKLHFGIRREADKFSWNDVSIAKQIYNHYGVCLNIANNKPYDIMESGVELVYMQKGGKIVNISPMPLPWVKDNG